MYCLWRKAFHGEDVLMKLVTETLALYKEHGAGAFQRNFAESCWETWVAVGGCLTKQALRDTDTSLGCSAACLLQLCQESVAGSQILPTSATTELEKVSGTVPAVEATLGLKTLLRKESFSGEEGFKDYAKVERAMVSVRALPDLPEAVLSIMASCEAVVLEMKERVIRSCKRRLQDKVDKLKPIRFGGDSETESWKSSLSGKSTYDEVAKAGKKLQDLTFGAKLDGAFKAARQDSLRSQAVCIVDVARTDHVVPRKASSNKRFLQT